MAEEPEFGEGGMARRRSGWVFAVCMGLLAVGLAASGGAHATVGTMSITVDTVLSEDHTGRIVIEADGVTLDCAGHVVQGPGAGTDDGVLVFQHDGVTVKNCDIRDFHIGIRAEDAVGTVLDSNTVSGNPQNGILLIRGANDGTVSNNTVIDNANEGITVVESSGNTLDANTVDNTNKGVVLVDADSSTVSNNTVTRGWSWFTIGILDGSDGNTVTGNTVSITGIGILLNGSVNNLVSGNTASVADEGIGLFGGAANNTITNNDSSDNRRNGFIADVGTNTGNTFAGNTAHRNGKFGFEDLTGTATAEGSTVQLAASNSYSANLCIGNALGGSTPPGLCNLSGTFIDDDDSVFEFDIEWMADEGITKGCNPPTNDQFCPDSQVTRGQMAAFLVRAFDLPAAPSAGFIDTVGTTFEDDIDRLAAAGITKGCNPPANDRFCPDDNVRREVMAAFLVRALGYTDDGGGDLFVDDDDSIFEADIDKLATAGVTKGCNPPTNDRFCPTENVTRGQMAAFLRRALN